MLGYGGNPYEQNYATGGGGGAGGGFFGGGGSASQDSPGGGGRSSAKTSLRPVMIRQIKTASQPSPDADFRIDGVEVGQVTLCAVVRNISKHATNVSYTVEDGTGTIEVRQWLDNSSDDNGKSAEVELNKYIRVLGTIKSFQNKRSISAGHIRAAECYNEVMFHRLEVIYVHLQITKGGGDGSAGAGNSAANGAGSSSLAGAVGDFSAISNPTQRKIAQAISLIVTPDSEGVTVQDVSKKLPGISAAQIR